MRPLVFVLPFILAVSACETTTPAAPPGPTLLGGVDLNGPLRALGTEPFWSIDVADGVMVLTRPDRPNIRAASLQRSLYADSAVIRGRTAQGSVLVLTLSVLPCSDGMSDRSYPLTARMSLGQNEDTRLSGCAASTSAIMSAGESGPVAD